LLIVIPAVRITMKPALVNHPFIGLKAVAQNRWSLTGTGILSLLWVCDLQLCKQLLANTDYW